MLSNQINKRQWIPHLGMQKITFSFFKYLDTATAEIKSNHPEKTPDTCGY